MKLRASPKTGRMVVELERSENEWPAVPLPEIRLKRILVPVDFSPCSLKALQYSVPFAKQFSAEIVLLHVVEPPIYSEGAMLAVTAAFDDTSIREAAARRLSEWRNEIASGATVEANVRTGVPYHEIILAAEETNTDLIVIGTHGRGRLARMFIGSTAERVVRHARCPVMVIRDHEHDFISATAAMSQQAKPSVRRKSRAPRSASAQRAVRTRAR